MLKLKHFYKLTALLLFGVMMGSFMIYQTVPVSAAPAPIEWDSSFSDTNPTANYYYGNRFDIIDGTGQVVTLIEEEDYSTGFEYITSLEILDQSGVQSCVNSFTKAANGFHSFGPLHTVGSDIYFTYSIQNSGGGQIDFGNGLVIDAPLTNNHAADYIIKFDSSCNAQSATPFMTTLRAANLNNSISLYTMPMTDNGTTICAGAVLNSQEAAQCYTLATMASVYEQALPNLEGIAIDESNQLYAVAQSTITKYNISTAAVVWQYTDPTHVFYDKIDYESGKLVLYAKLNNVSPHTPAIPGSPSFTYGTGNGAEREFIALIDVTGATPNMEWAKQFSTTGGFTHVLYDSVNDFVYLVFQGGNYTTDFIYDGVAQYPNDNDNAGVFQISSLDGSLVTGDSIPSTYINNLYPSFAKLADNATKDFIFGAVSYASTINFGTGGTVTGNDSDGALIFAVGSFTPPVPVTCTTNTGNGDQVVDVCLDVVAGALTIYAGDNADNNDICTKDDITNSDTVSVHASNETDATVTCAAVEAQAILTALTVTSNRQNTQTVIEDIVFEDLRGVPTAAYTVTATLSDLNGGSANIDLGSNPDGAPSDADADAPQGGDNGKIFAVLDPSGGTVAPLRPGSAISSGVGNFSLGSSATLIDEVTTATLFFTTSDVTAGRYELDGTSIKYRIPAFVEQDNYTTVMTVTIV